LADLAAPPPERTPVLIVGAGPVGLALSIVLAHHGVACAVVERNSTTTRHPKMDITNGRTMEIFRRLGIAGQVAAAGVPGDICLDVSWVTGLTGHEIHRFRYPPPNEVRAAYRALNDGTQSLEPAIRISQVVVEPLLRDIAAASPLVSLHYGWNFTGLDQDQTGVTATVEGAESGEARTIRAGYLAGCDGGGSRVREALGIALDGEANIRKRYSVHFRSRDKDVLEPWGPAWHYQSPVHGTLISQDGVERYTLHSFAPEDGEPDPYETVRRFVGRDFDFELVQAPVWFNNLLVADRYRAGRVFLAGDSAHQYIPTGGYGMNTGIGDAYGLGWMLAAVVAGRGGPGLLDAYEIERRPVGLRNCAASRRHAEARMAVGRIWPDGLDAAGEAGDRARAACAARVAEIGNAENESWGIEMGYRYDGSPVIVGEDAPAEADDPLRYRPTTRPGARPPAVYLADGAALFDRLGRGFTLLDFAPARHDAEPFRAAADRLGVELDLLPLDDAHAAALYERPLVLVRPDEHVCWRGGAVPDDPEGILKRVAGFAGGGDRANRG
jgi:2-polyprenyl-6-methoxyphenol hydroxylase-like FAD-dependent oxidoreductase